MFTIYHSPTANLTDFFANFKILNEHISQYQKNYDQYEIKMFFSDGRKRKLICNLAAVIEYLSKHDADSIIVYGIKQSGIKCLLLELNFDIVFIYDV